MKPNECLLAEIKVLNCGTLSCSLQYAIMYGIPVFAEECPEEMLCYFYCESVYPLKQQPGQCIMASNCCKEGLGLDAIFISKL